MMRYGVLLAACLVAMAAGFGAGPVCAAAADAKPSASNDAKQAEEGESSGDAPDITFIDWEDDEEGGESPPERPPAGPFELEPSVLRRDAVPGYIELSDGRKIPGKIYTTRARRLEIFNLERERTEHVPVPAVKEIEAVVEWARIERQWRFKEPGNPEKVYSGRTYPARMLAWRLTLRNDHVITGHILGQPLYVTREGETERWVLHKRQKGPIGTELDELLYIRRVVFGKPAYTKAVKEMHAKAAAEGDEHSEGAGRGEGRGEAAEDRRGRAPDAPSGR